MKTREELSFEGVLLLGWIVPPWFSKQSDGCSAPGGRLGKWLAKTKIAVNACYIHDFDYYLNAIQWKPKTPGWVGDRMQADYRLRINRRLVGKNKVFGWIYSRAYFRLVRLGGRYAMKRPGELVIPPSIEAIDDLEQFLHRPLTKQARVLLNVWRSKRE